MRSIATCCKSAKATTTRVRQEILERKRSLTDSPPEELNSSYAWTPRTNPTPKGVSEPRKLGYEEIFIQKHGLVSDKPGPEVFWTAVEKIAEDVVSSLDPNGKVSRAQLARALEDGKFPDDRGQVLAALYESFETITNLQHRRHIWEISSPDSCLTIAALKNLAARCIAAEGFHRRVVQIAYWAKDKGMIEKLGPGRKTILKKDLDALLEKQQMPSKDGPLGAVTSQGMANLDDFERLVIENFRADFDKIAKDGEVGTAEIDRYYERSRTTVGYRLANSLVADMKYVDLVQKEPGADKIFADPDHPLNSISAQAVTQEYLDDCAFRAALAGLAQARPQIILDAIRPAAPESNAIEVRFPGRRSESYWVKKPTREEIGLFSGEGKWGSWVTIMAKAYGARRCALSSGLSRSQIQPLLEEWAAEGTVLESDVVATLTGHRGNPFLLAEMSVADVLARLKSALENHQVVCLTTEAATLARVTKDGFLTKHAFTVLGLTTGNEVVVRDPHNGASREGTSQVTIEQLKDNFRCVILESDESL